MSYNTLISCYLISLAGSEHVLMLLINNKGVKFYKTCDHMLHLTLNVALGHEKQGVIY